MKKTIDLASEHQQISEIENGMFSYSSGQGYGDPDAEKEDSWKAICHDKQYNRKMSLINEKLQRSLKNATWCLSVSTFILALATIILVYVTYKSAG